MSQLEYINRKGKKHYLHEGTTKTGKPKYFFSLKSEGSPVNAIPEGYEIYEHPNAQVFLRKIPDQFITSEELAIVREGVQKHLKIEYFILDVRGKNIVLHTCDQSVENLMELSKLIFGKSLIQPRKILTDWMTYSPIMQFVLSDLKRREFVVERWCFRGSVDDWISLDSSTDLKALVDKYTCHLNQESFFDLRA